MWRVGDRCWRIGVGGWLVAFLSFIGGPSILRSSIGPWNCGVILQMVLK